VVLLGALAHRHAGLAGGDGALKRYFPTSTLISGFDIIFFWVARMMMMQLAVTGEVPFRDVYVHALVRDEKGRKMSKSIGNVLDPLELVDEYGADALRFTLTSMAAMGRDLKLSKDRIQGYRNFGTKLWNAARFRRDERLQAGGGVRSPPVTQTVNKWIVGETARARMAHDEALAQYRFNDAANGLYAFVWHKVCDWYLEFAKPLFASGDEAVIAETRATMAWVIDQCLILLHPTMPFITEELWGEIASGPRC
jgi:valyl-tRNA synthetase